MYDFSCFFFKFSSYDLLAPVFFLNLGHRRIPESSSPADTLNLVSAVGTGKGLIEQRPLSIPSISAMGTQAMRPELTQHPSMIHPRGRLLVMYCLHSQPHL